MTLSHAYSAPKPKNYTGIGLVVALHVAGIYALSAGLIQPPSRAEAPPAVKALPPEERVKPEEPKRVVADMPILQPPRQIEVEPPDIRIAPAQDSLITTVPARPDATPTDTVVTTARVEPPALPLVKPAISAPGAVCSTMPRPEVPSVSWSGEAVLQVLATVRGGRVVGSEVRFTQGAMDAKTRRSLQRSVESALAGYQCQGDATFQQDFAFRLD